MNIPLVDLHAQYLSIQSEIDSAIRSVISDTAFIKGKYVEKFEKEYAEFMGTKHCVGCANGTDSIEIILRALDISKGDEVLVPANTWISTSEAVTTMGAKVCFVDCDPKTYTIDINKIEEKITKNTKAIIPVHLYGLPAEMDKIMEIAAKYNLKVIEDCAQAHAAKYKGKLIGTFGNAGSFSFFPGKNLGAYGDAGGIVTNDDALAKKCKMIGDHGRLGKFDHGLEGRNSRLDGLQAAILSAKLPYLERWTGLRGQHAELYTKLLSNFDIQLPVAPSYSRHAYHIYVIQIPNRDKVRELLNSKGIATGIHYPKALPYLAAYQYMQHTPQDFPVAYNAMDRILSLPLYPELSEANIKAVVDGLQTALSAS